MGWTATPTERVTALAISGETLDVASRVVRGAPRSAVRERDSRPDARYRDATRMGGPRAVRRDEPKVSLAVIARSSGRHGRPLRWRRVEARWLLAVCSHGRRLRGSRWCLAGDFTGSEWAGATFEPKNGNWLFVNIQSPGITFAITRPWRKGAL